MDYFIIILLICLSGVFSGLTIGLASLSKEEIERRSHLGNAEAKKVLSVIKDYNLLLVTLLLGNTIVNSALTNYLGSLIGTGLSVVILSSFLILVFGEITPAAVITKYALQVGAKSTPLVNFIIFILYPISKPISYILNKVLKQDIGSILERDELSYIINKQQQSVHSDIDEQDSRILKGVLSMHDIVSAKVATKRRDIYDLKYDQIIDLNKINEIKEKGFTRIPVKKDRRVIGIINVKNLLGLTEEVEAIDIMESDKYLNIEASTNIDDVLHQMISSHIHIAIINTHDKWLGILTMEDILEVMFQEEIYDETDQEEEGS
ncbi:DUF21 domain-containing protein [bacterium]|jgi:metal transporter CNNM|nr:DUF21 domain-containing protein [bacterium]